MFRFTIRDVLWLTVVVAVVALLWRDRIAIKKERASLQEQVAAEREEIAAGRAAFNKDAAKMAELNRMLNARQRSLDSQVEYRARVMASVLRPVGDAEIEASKRTSADLGAPQPKPLPPGYGEKPN
jgi:uncharacterized membrane protein YcjF (UPF0283 family)